MSSTFQYLTTYNKHTSSSEFYRKLGIVNSSGQSACIDPDKHLIYVDNGMITIFPLTGSSTRLCSTCLESRLLSSKRMLELCDKNANFIDDDILDSIIKSPAWLAVLNSPTYNVIQLNTCESLISINLILPMPDCKICFSQPVYSKNISTHETTILESTSSIVCDPGGVLLRASCEQYSCNDIISPIWISKIQASCSNDFNDNALASGKGIDLNDALTGGLGEGLEQYSFYHYSRLQPIHKRPDNNNGWAVHIDKSSAIEASVNELVERDAFLCSWLSRRTAGQLNPRSHSSKLVHDVLDFCQAIGFQVSILLLKTDIQRYVVTAMLWHCMENTDIPHTVCGLGCSESAEEAAKRALFEAIQMIPAIQYHTLGYSGIDVERWDPGTHGGYYGKSFRFQELQHVIKPTADIYRFDDFIDYNITADEIIKMKNITIHDVTPEDLRFLGFSVISAKSDKLLNLYFGKNTNILTERRVREIYGSTTLADNTDPHPLC